MKKSLLVVLSVLFLVVGASAFAQGGYFGGQDECPDFDNDGICNGQDPDYVPGSECPCLDIPSLYPDVLSSEDPLHVNGWYGGLEECKDDDGDGICNCLDPDYVR